jgi:rubrerythrin
VTVDIAKAIRTAIEYENRVRDTYSSAVENAVDPVGRRIFQTLADEEQGHVDYLEHCLATWLDRGILVEERLGTAIPSVGRIREAVARLDERLCGEMGPACEGPELDLLHRALEVEVETSRFYEEMVRVLPAEGRKLFSRFLEIEEGHRAIVQAEIDSVTGTGFWFDIQEFDLEAG